jgi:hypothetical protein
MSEDQNSPYDGDLSNLVITLLRGVLYHEENEKLWNALLQLQTQLRDYVSVLGLQLVLDEAEGYAFLRSRPDDPDADGEQQLLRLVNRRQLTFPVSLLLALLRKKLAEFDAGGGDTRLVLSRDEIVDLIRLFLPDSSNEARLIDQVDTHINKVVDLGFLRRMKPSSSGNVRQAAHYEVRRILKSFVDAQWLAELDDKLEAYRCQLTGKGEDDDE